ncbi:MAG: hypothetical protein MUE85_18435, partial [Microscillaceae bacterium]|nr:hypothetical protein [Microscillaceae bacterium]
MDNWKKLAHGYKDKIKEFEALRDSWKTNNTKTIPQEDYNSYAVKITGKTSIAVILLDAATDWDIEFTQKNYPNWDFIAGYTFDHIMTDIIKACKSQKDPLSIVISTHGVYKGVNSYFGKLVNYLNDADFRRERKENSGYVNYFYKLGEVLPHFSQICFGTCQIGENTRLGQEITKAFNSNDTPEQKYITVFMSGDGNNPTRQISQKGIYLNYTLLVDRGITSKANRDYGFVKFGKSDFVIGDKVPKQIDRFPDLKSYKTYEQYLNAVDKANFM